MKLFKYGMSLAALALLASCANDNIVDNPQESTPDINGTAYLALNISMPGDASGRAGDETYEDGDASEYAVKDGKVYIFEKAGSSEDEYKFVKAGDLGTTIWENQGNQITTSSKTAVATFTSVSLSTSADTKYYALVVLNDKDTPTLNSNDTFKKWKEQTGANYKNDEGYFTMTNAPLMTSGSIATLVEIDNTKIGTSKENLQPAAEIYVQRIAAKVDFTSSVVTVTTTGTSESDKDQVVFSEWGLNYTNKKTYPVQLANNYIKANNNSTWFATTTAPNYFIGEEFKASTDDGSNHQRIFWAEDPNYEVLDDNQAKTVNAQFNTTAQAADGLDKPIYCLENTMKYDAMLTNQSTHFYVKASYWVGGKKDTGTAPSFVAVDGWKATLDQLNANAKVVASSEQPVSYLEWKASEAKKGVDITEVVTLTESGKTAYKAVLGDAVQEDQLTDEQVKAGVKFYIGVNGDLNNVNFYKDGVMYYASPIRHFNGAPDPSETVSGVAKYSETHLGRFGLVRNNWYNIKIQSISGLGDPTTPPTPEPGDEPDPDDPDKDQYMQCQIHILSWAKRSHSYDL